MVKHITLFFGLLLTLAVQAQQSPSLHKEKVLVLTTDTLQIPLKNINPKTIKLLHKGKDLHPKYYTLYPEKQILKLYIPNDTVQLQYSEYPNFLTQKYQLYPDDKVVKNEHGQLLALSPQKNKNFIPFEGLQTDGNISRGITTGNNQNTTLSSQFNLQAQGKLSDKVHLRASIKDSNIPLQNEGYSQRFNEFDQIFVELFGKNWAVQGGDLTLNSQNTFLHFTKKIRGVNTFLQKPDSTAYVQVAGSLTRGQYAQSTFTGQEGNQGPYKLKGNQGELYILVIAGSERVFVNGIVLERGENKHYTIDYNAGEIIFTTLYPITSEMRIVVEYQYTQQVFNRLNAYVKAGKKFNHWTVETTLFSENDLKNKPILQNLTDSQKIVLEQSGDNPELMMAQSAYQDTYTTGKILYQKQILNGIEYFEYSTDTTQVLYNVKFSYQGTNQGNYQLKNAAAVGKIYEYIAPINGIKQGAYEPVIRLVAPTAVQIISGKVQFNPSSKTNLTLETAWSNTDKNLFSSTDDQNNQAQSAVFKAQQQLFNHNQHQLKAFAEAWLIHQNFSPIERMWDVNFNRSWNITQTFTSQQQFIKTGYLYNHSKQQFSYTFEHLSFPQQYNGNRHLIHGKISRKYLSFQQFFWITQAQSGVQKSKFASQTASLKAFYKNTWSHTFINWENNQDKNQLTQQLSSNSQRFLEKGITLGVGDSLKVFMEIGAKHRTNDSVQSGLLTRKNNSYTLFLKSTLIQKNNQNLNLYLNYRSLSYTQNLPDETSVNAKINYRKTFLNQFLQYNTSFETSSGTLPQQEFTFVAVETGRGVYTWNDYNNNSIQEIQEFEIAPFPDLANYVKIYLPNQYYLKTHRNKLSQGLVIQPHIPNHWINRFYNQTTLLIDQKIERKPHQFNFNIFNQNNPLALQSLFQNILYYNRNKSHHTLSYTYQQAKTLQLLSAGSQQIHNTLHQLEYNHTLYQLWLLTLSTQHNLMQQTAENYTQKNYKLNSTQLQGKLTYNPNTYTSLELSYQHQYKKNQETTAEKLTQHRIGTSFTYKPQSGWTLNTTLQYTHNLFNGSNQSAIAFQMMEGLQNGKNITGILYLQKSLTQYISLTLSYQARKTADIPFINTGSVQLQMQF